MFDRLSIKEQQIRLRTCQDVYYSQIGWTNSATGCGKCPSKTPSAFCENSPSACAEVAALSSLQNAMLQLGKSIEDSIVRAAVAKIESTSLEFISESAPLSEPYAEVRRVIPSGGSPISVGLNEVISASVSGFYSECVVPLFGHEKTRRLADATHYIIANEPLCKLEQKKNEFHGTYFNVIKASTEKPVAAYPYAVTEKKKGIDICQRAMGFNQDCSKKHSVEDFIFGWGFVSDKRSQPSRILYRGGSANEVFLELIVDGVSRRFVHNLNEGATFGCGQYELEITFADGEVITFKPSVGSLDDIPAGCASEIQGDFSEVAKAATNTPADRIRALTELLDMGLISREEFEAKRSEIISTL